jgi:hypothetical protein
MIRDRPIWETCFRLDPSDGIVHNVYEEDKDEHGGWESVCDSVTDSARPAGREEVFSTCLRCLHYANKWHPYGWL